MKKNKMNSACSLACIWNGVQQTSETKEYTRIVLLLKWILKKYDVKVYWTQLVHDGSRGRLL
jgi:hypothetical protein